jgi:hypothetical protein
VIHENDRSRTDISNANGDCHVCYMGTLLPLGIDTLPAVLRASALLRECRADLYERLRLHFFGTSNQTNPSAPARVIPAPRGVR